MQSTAVEDLGEQMHHEEKIWGVLQVLGIIVGRILKNVEY